METQVEVNEARVKLVKPDSPEWNVCYLVGKGNHVPIAKKCVEEAVRRSNMHDDLLDVCKDMASILNGLYLGTKTFFPRQIDRIREVEKIARALISKDKDES